MAALSLSSCNHLLEDNRYPLDQQTNTPEYWNTSANVELQINFLYYYYLGYGNTTSWVNNFYYRSLGDDQCTHMYSGDGVQFARWEYQQVPTNASEWDDGYTAIRRINNIIQGVSNSTLAEGEKNSYLGIARMNRAYQYYQLVRCFGDVPLVQEVLDPNDTEALYGPRVSRNTVMDAAYEDVQFAVDNILTQSSVMEFSADMANAMKAEICLFEAAYSRYALKDDTRATTYYNRVVEACQAIMSKSYRLCDNYQSLYNSVFTANAADGLESLTANPEVIFMKAYETGVKGHSLLAYLSAGTMINGITKDAFDAFLFKDGKPLALTTEDTSDAAKLIIEGTDSIVSIQHLLDVRDDRLSMTVDPFLAWTGHKAARSNSDFLSSSTGYLIKKYVNPNLPSLICVTDGQSNTCAPLYWLAEIYLAYAEAKAELGTITDSDLDATINKLYTRAGLPTQTVASLSSMNDPANNMNVSSLLWEIRRCRRCELMMDNYHRYWDLIRWHQLDKLDSNNYPNIALGANLSDIPSELTKEITLVNGYVDGASTGSTRQTRTFTEREYFYPIGKNQIDLYTQKGYTLSQNPGW